MEELEPVEELVPLEEEEGYVATKNLEKGDILSEKTAQYWQQSYAASCIPSLITDPRLVIIWENEGFSQLLSREKENVTTYLPHVFQPYLDHEKTKAMLQSIRSQETGYSWHGRVKASGREHLTVIANIILTPLYRDGNPIGYGVILDDITEDNRSLLRNTFLSLLEASKLKDNDTGNHIERVNQYSQLLAEHLYDQTGYDQVDREFIDNIGFLAAMHDVGKIGTPDDILNKEGPLDQWEWDIMKEHTINGAYILSTYPNEMAKEIALFHHEQWNGSGYPYAVSETLIPLSARIVAIADVYDALRMKRSYKSAFTHSEAYREIVASAGKHFDPELIDLFDSLHQKFAGIFDELSREEE
jgi:HD-GYP domain-containing protein (c-di-GMP phosphodiesterase class II)